MARRAHIRILGVAILLAPTLTLGGERELLQLWNSHMAGADNHAAVVGACRHYVAARPKDPFVPVVHGIEAWHLLRAGRVENAEKRLAPYPASGADPLAEGANRLARAWTTRMLRDDLVEALQFYYRREVRYPPDLETLATYPGVPDATTVPLADLWMRKWRYRLTGFQGVPGFRDQKYELESVSIQPPSDLAAALAFPYAEQIDVKPAPLTINSGDVPVTKFERVTRAQGKEVIVIPTGSEVDGLFLAYAGREFVIVCDTLHWKVLEWNTNSEQRN